MPGMHGIATQLTMVEEKLHFLRQSITACKSDCFQPEALAGLAHIVSDLVMSVQEVRRDIDAVKSRVENPQPPCPASEEPSVPEAEEPDEEDLREQRYHGNI